MDSNTFTKCAQHHTVDAEDHLELFTEGATDSDREECSVLGERDQAVLILVENVEHGFYACNEWVVTEQ